MPPNDDNITQACLFDKEMIRPIILIILGTWYTPDEVPIEAFRLMF